MKKQRMLTIEPMKFPKDKYEIASWEIRFQGEKGLDYINKFILEDGIFTGGLGEVIETNHENFPIGNDERKFAFVARDPSGEIVAWSLIDFFNISTTEPSMFIQYIVVHPRYQKRGYGKTFAKELILNPESYIGGKPKEYFAYIDKENQASRRLFEDFGFDIEPIKNTRFFRAITTQPELRKNNNQFGK